MMVMVVAKWSLARWSCIFYFAPRLSNIGRGEREVKNPTVYVRWLPDVVEEGCLGDGGHYFSEVLSVPVLFVGSECFVMSVEVPTNESS